MADRMECLRLALGGRYDGAKPLTMEEATDAIAVADALYAWACQDDALAEGQPVTIEGVAYPSAAGYMGMDG